MKLKYSKLCSFNMDIAEKLNSEPNRKANLVINEAIEAHYDKRIIPANCKVEKLDITDWIIEQIKLSKETTKLEYYKLKTSSFVVFKKDKVIDNIAFYLINDGIELEIHFNVIVDNGIEIQFKKWFYDAYYSYEIDFDDNRLKEIEESVIFKL